MNTEQKLRALVAAQDNIIKAQSDLLTCYRYRIIETNGGPLIEDTQEDCAMRLSAVCERLNLLSESPLVAMRKAFEEWARAEEIDPEKREAWKGFQAGARWARERLRGGGDIR